MMQSSPPCVLEDTCRRRLAKETLPPPLTWLLVHPDGSWTITPGIIPEGLPDGTYTIMMRHKLLEQKYGLNSDEVLAVEILDLIHLMRMALTDHDMASPHVWAFRLGEVAESARFKRLWEPQVEFSKKTREKRRKANEESIKTRAAISKKNRDASRSKAIELWRHTPMNIKPTADIIAKDLNLNPHTTRGYLMHPEEWSPFHSLKTKKFDHP